MASLTGPRAYQDMKKFLLRLGYERRNFVYANNDLKNAFNSNGLWDFGAYQMKSLKGHNSAIAVTGAPCSAGGATVGP